jgi:site-specific recombinase XerD
MMGMAPVLSFNTRREYRSDWQRFDRWARKRGVEPLLAAGQEIDRYFDEVLSARKPVSAASALRSLYAIQAHLKAVGRENAIVSPYVAELRVRLAKEARLKMPRVRHVITIEHLRQAFAEPALRPLQLRDRAFVLSACVHRLPLRMALTIKIADVQKSAEGLILRVGQRFIPIPKGVTALCPVNAIEQWLGCGLAVKGYLFPPFGKGGPRDRSLGRDGVRIVLQRVAVKVGMNPVGICYSSLLLGAEADSNPTRALGL